MNKQMKIFMWIVAAAIVAIIIYYIYQYNQRQKSAAKPTDTNSTGGSAGSQGGTSTGSSGTGTGSGTTTVPVNDSFPLKVGSSGPKVKILQQVANKAVLTGIIPGTTGTVVADGVFGTKTKDLVNKWKSAVGFLPDGQITFDEYNTYVLPQYIATIIPG